MRENFSLIQNHYIENIILRDNDFSMSAKIETRRFVIKGIRKQEEINHTIFIDFHHGNGSLKTIDAGISFNKIERIVMPLVVKYKFAGKIILERPDSFFTVSLNKLEEVILMDDPKFARHIISTLEEANNEIVRVNDFYIERATPFFNQYGVMKELYEQLIDSDYIEMYRILNAIGAYQRKMIILRKFNYEKYINFADKYINEFKLFCNTSESSGYDLRGLNMTLELDEVLRDKDFEI